ncbi:peptidoglycan DD-metalloendopeptidase family protein [Sporosarcina sp. FSL K6-1508]|uniref:peptidoglycan DD-metalloendopeptidase family protein n=1 Tax=Sporosarcina sp. FSL K6-1508 TaxID=2921553 RepID=UPI0030F710C3
MFIKPCEGRITSYFSSARLDPVGGKVVRPHWGVDYGNTPANNSIIAAAAGKVVRARNAETDGYGKLVMIEHVIKGVLYTTVYAHLSSIAVKDGQVLKQGQRFGVKGTTGNSTGIHLHFEIHIGKWNNQYTGARNPLHFIVDPEILRLQTLLVKVGHKIATDGMFGPATDNAIKLFQKSAGLVVDGSAGPLTMAALEKAAAPKPKPKPEPEAPKKEEKLLKLAQSQKNEMALVYKHAREKGIFTSDQHEKDVAAGKMTESRAAYLATLIAGAAVNGGKRIK